jgi:hypothetical protein
MTLTRLKIISGSVALSILIALPAAAVDDNSEAEADYEGAAVPIDRKLPTYPRKRAGRLQAAWVQLSRFQRWY